mgnify:CR=1 FL=1
MLDFPARAGVPAFADPAKYDLHVASAVTWSGGLPGMNVGRALDPKVALDRDGKPFRVREGMTGEIGRAHV